MHSTKTYDNLGNTCWSLSYLSEQVKQAGHHAGIQLWTFNEAKTSWGKYSLKCYNIQLQELQKLEKHNIEP